MSKTKNIPYICEATLASLALSTADVIKSIESLIFSVADQAAWTAPKAVMLPEDGRYMMATLAAADEPAILAVKTLISNPNNYQQGLPQINGLVTLLDSRNGLPLAILDGGWITAVRTAAMSATAAKYMAKPESSVAAFIGCGVQATSHLAAFADLFPLAEVRLFGRGPKNIEIFCGEVASRSIKAIVCNSAEAAIKGVDIVVSSVTYSAQMQPFLDANLLKPGAFAAIADLAAPWHQASFKALDRLVIDDLIQEASLPNKLVPADCISGDLSQLVLGKIDGRINATERSAFVFRGHALGDLSLSALAYQKFVETND